MRVENSNATAISAQAAEFLFCHACESTFADSEQYVASIAPRANGTFPALDATKNRILSSSIHFDTADASVLDCAKISHFAVGVVWRAAVSTTFPDVTMESQLQRELGDYILHRRGLPANVDVACNLVLPNLGTTIYKTFIPPDMEETKGQTHYRFLLTGVAFHIHVQRNLVVKDEMSSLHEHKRIGHALDAELQEQIKLLVIGSTPTGALAKWLTTDQAQGK